MNGNLSQCMSQVILSCCHMEEEEEEGKEKEEEERVEEEEKRKKTRTVLAQLALSTLLPRTALSFSQKRNVIRGCKDPALKVAGRVTG